MKEVFVQQWQCSYKKDPGLIALSNTRIVFSKSEEDPLNNIMWEIHYTKIRNLARTQNDKPKALIKIIDKSEISYVVEFTAETPFNWEHSAQCFEKLHNFTSKEHLQRLLTPLVVDESERLDIKRELPQEEPNESESPTKKRPRMEISSKINEIVTSEAGVEDIDFEEEYLQKYSEKIDNNIDLLKQKVLQQNPNIEQLYTSLVTRTHTLTEDDFWNSHKDALEMVRNEQVLSIKKLNPVSLSSLTTTSNTVASLTGTDTISRDETIPKEIISQTPILKLLFKKLVPNIMTENIFFRRLLRSKAIYLLEGRTPSNFAEDDPIFDDLIENLILSEGLKEKQKSVRVLKTETGFESKIKSSKVLSNFNPKLFDETLTDNYIILNDDASKNDPVKKEITKSNIKTIGGGSHLLFRVDTDASGEPIPSKKLDSDTTKNSDARALIARLNRNSSSELFLSVQTMMLLKKKKMNEFKQKNIKINEEFLKQSIDLPDLHKKDASNYLPLGANVRWILAADVTDTPMPIINDNMIQSLKSQIKNGENLENKNVFTEKTKNIFLEYCKEQVSQNQPIEVSAEINKELKKEVVITTETLKLFWTTSFFDYVRREKLIEVLYQYLNYLENKLKTIITDNSTVYKRCLLYIIQCINSAINFNSNLNQLLK